MPKRPVSSKNSGFILGRAAFDRISAVEGLRRNAASEAMFVEFDRLGLGAEERQRAIRAQHGVEVVAHGQDNRSQEASSTSSSRRRRIAIG